MVVAPQMASERKKSTTLIATMAVRTAIVAINVVDFFLSLAIWGATTTVRIAG